MKKIKIGLLGRILIAIALGIGIGMVTPDFPVRIFVTFNDIFSEFLGFIVPLIIVGLVTPAIADIGKGAGRMLVATVVLAYIATLISGFMSYGVGESIFPSLLTQNISLSTISDAKGVAPFFKIDIPAPLDIMTALVLAFVVGLGISTLKSTALRDACNDFRDIIEKTIQSVVIPMLPIYIFGVFFNMTHSGQVFNVLSAFAKVIVVIFILHIVLLIFQYSVAGLIVKKNPFKLLSRMMPAYFTALGTSSSAATIPVALKQTIQNGVREDVAGFVVPLFATIHLSGSTLKIVACALALMMIENIPYDFSMFSGFIFMLGVVMVAAPGVPGGAVMASLGILDSILGFDENSQTLMIALYIAMDSFGTACNVTGDGALALIVDKCFAGKKVDVPTGD